VVLLLLLLLQIILLYLEMEQFLEWSGRVQLVLLVVVEPPLKHLVEQLLVEWVKVAEVAEVQVVVLAVQDLMDLVLEVALQEAVALQVREETLLLGVAQEEVVLEAHQLAVVEIPVVALAHNLVM
tara:strand:+ start:499 stop:873 length:375 start_codon:yes stop_codon:yes gene_type:complete